MLKKVLSSALALCLVFGTAAVLPEGAVNLGSQIEASAFETYGDYKYWLLDDGTVTIGRYNGNDTEVAIPSTIDGKKVTSIGSEAFNFCESLTSITIPNSVTRIGSYAFSFCNNLTSITIPDSVTSIGDQAFYGCTSLASITIPNSITSIGSDVFGGCTGLTSINVGTNNTKYSSVDGVLYNKEKTELIRCPGGKTSLTIPNSVTSIGNDAFSNCESLISITIPNSVTSIGNDAFYHCTSLTSITIPNSVTSIDYGVFEGCTSLTSITIPNSVKRINSKEFFCCSSLTSITIPDSITSIDNDAFIGCTSLTSITIPDSVTFIGESAFEGCTNLTSITIPNSDIIIGEDAFWNCPNLTIKCYSDSAAEQYAMYNEIKHELLPAPAHTHSYTTKVVAPTYTSEGYTLHTCSCGDSYKDNIKPKLTRTSLAKASVSGLKNKTYTGKAITQTPVVKLGNKTLKSGTDYTVTYKNNKAVGTATVTVTGKGAYTGTVKATFKICPKKTTLKTVKSPKTKQLKATYTKVAGVTGYQITYSTSSKFTKKTTKSVNASGTSKTISKLTKGKTYYVKVRTYKTVNGTKYYSGYSAVKKIKVK